MKIKSIYVWRKNLGSKKPYTIAFKTIDDVDCAFVRVQLSDGTYGLGAANPSEQVVGESLDDTMHTLSEENLQFLIGRDIREYGALLKDVVRRFPKTPAARAALDIAIHDAFSKYLGVPLVTFLGQKHQKMETSVTIGIKGVEDTLAEAKEYYDLGFRCLKVKTGNDVAEDIARIKKLRETYGQNLKIRVDANQGYSETDLLHFHKETQADELELIEQPVKAAEVELLKQLPAEVKQVIAADESLKSPDDAFKLASAPAACGIFNIKLMKSGGIYPACRIGHMAGSAGIDLMWGCNDESAISIAAALHTALSFPNTRYIDLDGSLDLKVDIVTGGFRISNGWMSLTDKPGLGVELIE